jgi:hypothetical protein
LVVSPTRKRGNEQGEEREQRNATRLERGRMAIADALGVSIVALADPSAEELLAAFPTLEAPA